MYDNNTKFATFTNNISLPTIESLHEEQIINERMLLFACIIHEITIHLLFTTTMAMSVPLSIVAFVCS